mmetsp:Transcript_34400/g.44373  ORF Transcript_34400/g.44373 Transcript_34400/m.44373 type:complete len:135 (-) Transcript_34400:56-460(-)
MIDPLLGMILNRANEHAQIKLNPNLEKELEIKWQKEIVIDVYNKNWNLVLNHIEYLKNFKKEQESRISLNLRPKLDSAINSLIQLLPRKKPKQQIINENEGKEDTIQHHDIDNLPKFENSSMIYPISFSIPLYK